MTHQAYHAQLLAPAVDVLVALDHALVWLLTATYNATTTAWQAIDCDLVQIGDSLRHRLPSREQLLAQPALVCLTLLGVALAAIALTGVTLIMIALSSCCRLSSRALCARFFPPSEKSSDARTMRTTPSSPCHAHPELERNPPTKQLLSYDRYTDCSVLEAMKTRNDMLMIERWRVRPQWSSWPERVLMLLKRKDYDELRLEIGRDLNKGSLKRICQSIHQAACAGDADRQRHTL
jgi:hypothetical protein